MKYIILLLTVILTSCFSGDLVDGSGVWAMTLKNSSGLEYHMFIDGESFDSSNRLQNKETRLVYPQFAKDTDGNLLDKTITVYVGFNGNIEYSESFLMESGSVLTSANWNGKGIETIYESTGM